MYKIETGVPVAEPRRTNRYPFRDMKPGDSFLVTEVAAMARTRNAAHVYGRYHGWKFKTAQVDKGMRVWRVE